MSESGDYDPGPWRGHDFGSARKRYDVHVGRSYDDARSSNKDISELVEKSLETNSESPLVIACDVTGSMGEWPATMFSKLPYLELEGKEYLGDDMEISFAAVGDVYSDDYALQVRKFTKGTELKEKLEELVIEGGGGGQTMESYDLCALYYSRKVKMPKAIKPIFIFIGDEGCYDSIDRESAKTYAGIELKERLPTKQVMKDLQSKYSVYLIRKPYDNGYGDSMSSTDKKLYKEWADMLGEDHISILPDPNRVVDVIFGILAKETQRLEYFKEEITERQKPGQVKTVMKALKTIHKPLPKKSLKKLPMRKSVMHKKGGKDEEESKSLL